jgi:hypothetical protein
MVVPASALLTATYIDVRANMIALINAILAFMIIRDL